jgi:hypothetical protein
LVPGGAFFNLVPNLRLEACLKAKLSLAPIDVPKCNLGTRG